MEVQLYVYDLARGMARGLSQSFLGIQIDAVYHTSLVFDQVEYFFGRGIQTCSPPGTTHHGRPMEIVPMGTTHIPMETILEYLDSLEEVYSPESYDLFAHNCNNFTNDFGMFLVGKGIPEHITNLPRRVLDTPMGAMLKAQIDASMRSITQAGSPPRSRFRDATRHMSSMTAPSAPAANGHAPTATPSTGVAKTNMPVYGSVVNTTDRSVLASKLKAVSHTAVTIFFTSSTCAPCKIAYPTFDQLAEQHPQALFIKVDINQAHDIAAVYSIRATPTFVTFSRGTQQDSWSGADPNLLRTNVEQVIRETFPPHPHALLKVPTIQYGSLKPVTYAKMPPLDKLMAKLGTSAREKEIVELRSFVEKRSGGDARDAPLPDLRTIGDAFQSKLLALPIDVRFAAVDLLRCAMVDARVGGFFAEEDESKKGSTIGAIVSHVNTLADACPHNLRLVTLHLACNIFASPLYVKALMSRESALTSALIQLIASSLLDASHPTTRVAAASLAFNVAVSNYRVRREENREAMDESAQVELAAALIQALSEEESVDASKALLLAIAYLFYVAPQDGELSDLAKALDAASVVASCKGHEALGKEVAALL